MTTSKARKGKPAVAPEPEPLALGNGTFAAPTRADAWRAYIASMRDQRFRRKQVTADQLVPAHVHQLYAQIWRGEDEARRAEERVRFEYSWRGLWRRMIDRIVGRPNPSKPYVGSSGCYASKSADYEANPFLHPDDGPLRL